MTKPETHPTQFWAGPEGTAYTARNNFDYRIRLPFWKKIVEATAATTFLEVGCNRGANLRCIREVAPLDSAMTGVDVNQDAINEAQMAGFDVALCEASGIVDLLGKKCAQLTFTCGVLIHIPPKELETVMKRIVETAIDYVLCVEYDAPEEQHVLYRGHKDKLWRRPYGKLYEELGCSTVETGELGKNDGFDSCKFVLLEVPR